MKIPLRPLARLLKVFGIRLGWQIDKVQVGPESFEMRGFLTFDWR